MQGRRSISLSLSMLLTCPVFWVTFDETARVTNKGLQELLYRVLYFQFSSHRYLHLTMCGHLYVISFVLSYSTSMRRWCGFYEYYVSYIHIISFRINQVRYGDFVSHTSQTWTWWIWWFLISFPMPEKTREDETNLFILFSLGLAQIPTSNA